MPNVLRNLKILEVSSVDRGAGDGVKIMIMKRADDVAKAWGPDHIEWTPADVELLVANPNLHAYTKRAFTGEQLQAAVDKGHAMPGGGFPIDNVDDLRNAVYAADRAKDPAAAKATSSSAGPKRLASNPSSRTRGSRSLRKTRSTSAPSSSPRHRRPT
jgi:hypothetical protein